MMLAKTSPSSRISPELHLPRSNVAELHWSNRDHPMYKWQPSKSSLLIDASRGLVNLVSMADHMHVTDSRHLATLVPFLPLPRRIRRLDTLATVA